MRELENVLERAVALCENNSIGAGDLRLAAGERSASAAADTWANTPTPQPTTTTWNDEPRGAPPTRVPEPPEDEGFPSDLAAAVAETERAAIMKALEATRWNRTAAAKQLGLTLRQLRYRLEKLGIE